MTNKCKNCGSSCDIRTEYCCDICARGNKPIDTHDRVYPLNDTNGVLDSYGFYCPGCKCHHSFAIKGHLSWKFNGDLKKPTFTPSLVVWHTRKPERRCHLFVTDGKIRFLSDCHHELAGKTVEMGDTND